MMLVSRSIGAFISRHPTIKVLALAFLLLIGIIAGTYSSIYISSAIALDCGLTAEHIFPTVKKAALDHLP